MKDTVVVGMSGGVDSSVAAYLLKEKGYNVIGVTMKMWDGGAFVTNDAQAVAKMLDIPFYPLDFCSEFKKNVIDYFVDEYMRGNTPNPCVVCNRYVKWEALLKRAAELGAKYIATGHYARIDRLSSGRYAVCNSVSSAKDQTYALYNLTQEQLSHTLMPVGEYEKPQIRAIAEHIGLKVADKPDSQEICFIPDKDYAGYIRRSTEIGNTDGNFVDEVGNILGRHKGFFCYTIGQRKGLNLAMGHPVFVKEIRPESNEVVIGEEECVFTKRLRADSINYMAVSELNSDNRMLAKIRYGHKGSMCSVVSVINGVIELEFDEPVRAITPGQSVVFYENGYVLGGGTIII